MCKHTNISISEYFLSKPIDIIPISVYNIIVRKTQRAKPKNERKMNMKKNGTEKINVKGITFEIGYVSDREFSGYVFSMKKDNKWYGVLLVNADNREIGWNSGIMATDDEIEAIEAARIILKENYGSDRISG